MGSIERIHNMPKDTAKPKRTQDFDSLHQALQEGKKINYSYDPPSEVESIRIYLHDKSGWALRLSPDGTYKLD